jgi:hypothetical protein
LDVPLLEKAIPLKEQFFFGLIPAGAEPKDEKD